MKPAPDAPVVAFDRVGLDVRGRTLLDDVSFVIEPGQFVAVIGENGAGKTTLLRTILGTVRPNRGTVNVFGHPAGRVNRAIGYVPQRSEIDGGTPLRGRDIVALGLDGERWGLPLQSAKTRARVDEMLAAVDATAFADAPIGNLSGGEQQRLALAQALIGGATLLLLDEPTANLDLRSTSEIVELVAKIGRERNITVVMVAHDINPLIGSIDRVLYLENGRAAIGTVEEVINEATLSALYGHAVDVVNVRGRIVVLAAESHVDRCRAPALR